MNVTAPKALNTRLSITLIFAVLVSLIMTTTASATDCVVKAWEQNGESKIGLAIFSVGVGDIIPCKYTSVKYLGDGLFAVQDDAGDCGVIDRSGNQILPFSY